MISCKAKIDIIGVNPFVFLPASVLKRLFRQAQRVKGPIPVKGFIDGHPFLQTLVRYRGAWRLYINTPMLKASGRKVGDRISLQIEFDPVVRTIPIHPKLVKALNRNQIARRVFDQLAPSLRKEMIRYISFLKTETSIDRNVQKAIQFLLGNERFIGRDSPGVR